MAKTIKWYNDKGNVLVQARDQVRKQSRTAVLTCLADNFEGVVENADGGVSIPVAQTENGETIYAHFVMTISTKSPTEKTVKKSAKKKTAATPIEVPDLFGDEE